MLITAQATGLGDIGDIGSFQSIWDSLFKSRRTLSRAEKEEVARDLIEDKRLLEEWVPAQRASMRAMALKLGEFDEGLKSQRMAVNRVARIAVTRTNAADQAARTMGLGAWLTLSTLIGLAVVIVGLLYGSSLNISAWRGGTTERMARVAESERLDELSKARINAGVFVDEPKGGGGSDWQGVMAGVGGLIVGGIVLAMLLRGR